MLTQALNVGQPTAQQYVTIAGGGEVLPAELAEMARAADAYPNAVMTVDEFGKGKGDTVKLQRDLYPAAAANGRTEGQRQIDTSEKTISTTGQNIQSEEVPVVLKEYFGPWDNAASDVNPYKIDNFSAKYRAAKEQLASKATRWLRRDYIAWLDAVLRNLFIANGGNTNVTFPTGIANAAAFTLGAGQGITLEQIFNARQAISDREWQKFGNGRYMCLVPTSFNTQMLGDVDYRELSKAHREGVNLLYGYIGSVQDIDFFEVTTLALYAASGGTFTNVNGSNVAASVQLHEALLFGPGVVGMGTAVGDQSGAVGPEARFHDDTNYGTIAKVIWYALHAFQTLDTRGCQRIVYQYL